MPGGKLDDQISMHQRIGAGGDDQSDIALLCERRYIALDLNRVSYVDRTDLDSAATPPRPG